MISHLRCNKKLINLQYSQEIKTIKNRLISELFKICAAGALYGNIHTQRAGFMMVCHAL